jgi:hypothetical protein
LFGLANSKISICVPSDITHPERTGNISTITNRYLQSMASKCLILGKLPHDMLHLFDYNHIIEIDEENPVLQIVFGSITTLTFEIMLRSLADSKVFAQGAPLHHKILSAIKDKDPDKAVAAMSKHLHIAENTFDADYDVALSVLADRVIQQTFGGSLTIHEILDSAFKNYSLDILR